MSIEEKIRKIGRDFYETKDKYLATKLVGLYLSLSKRKLERDKAVAACLEGFYCLKEIGCDVYVDVLNLRLKILQRELGRWLKQIQRRRSYN